MSKNILFIGPYRQGCSWGTAAKAYIRALVAGDFNVTIRPIYMGSMLDNNIDPDLIALEQQKFDHYDAVIQNVLPHLLDYNSRLGKNIALFYTESGGWKNSWPRKLNNMDMIFVPSRADLYNLEKSGVTTEAHNLPIPVDLAKYQQSENQAIEELKDTFNFYFIGELIERKNIELLLKAFHSEFERDEPVNLVLKVHKQGQSDQQTQEMLSLIINENKETLRIYNNIHMYKQEVAIIGFKPQAVIDSIHNSCHCLVMPSCGESWCMPVVDAIGYNNKVLVTEGTGPCDIIRNNPKYMIQSVEDSVNVLQPPLIDLYTGEEFWRRPILSSLKKKMREVYENRDQTLEDEIDISSYTYRIIGNIIKDILAR